MKKRPLCYVCLVFLLIKSVLLLLTGGQSGGLSADSIFQEEKEKEVILQGQVYQKTSTSKMQILYLKNNSINSQNESFYESKIIVYDKTFQNIAIGKTVKLCGKPMCLKRRTIRGILTKGNIMQNKIFMAWSGVNRLWK